MVLVCLAIFAVCMLWAAANDIATMKIPNLCVLLLLAAFFAAVPFSNFGWAQLGDHVVVATGTLVVCFCLFMFGTFGAGDGKLIAASALWLGPSSTMSFVLLLALFGGFLALGILLMRNTLLPVRLASHPIVARLSSKDRAMPYAAAIGPAGLVALLESPWASYLPFAAS